MMISHINRLRLLSIIMILGGAILLGYNQFKIVLVLVNDEPIIVRTFGFTVANALKVADIVVDQNDDVIPNKNSWIGHGDVIKVLQAINFQLQVNDELFHILSTDRVPANILAQQDIKLFPGDGIFYNGINMDSSVPIDYQKNLFLNYKESVNIGSQGGANNYIFEQTMGQYLWDSGSLLTVGDDYLYDLGQIYYLYNSGSMSHSKIYKVEVDDQMMLVESQSNIVGEILSGAGLSLQGLDFSAPGLNELAGGSDNIKIVRVREEVVLEQELIPFYTQWQPVEDLEIDNFTLVNPGEYGLQASRIRIRYENGEEVKRIVEDQWIVREPVPRVEGYGTKIVIRTLETPSGVIKYWRAVNVYATSYTASTAGTPIDAPNYGITYSGESLRTGHIAVLRSWYPSMGGRSFYVPGYGFGLVADIGGGFPDRDWIDLGYYEDEWVSWHNWVTIYFLAPVPPADQILWILP